MMDKMFRQIMYFLILIALAGSVSAENMTYVYTTLNGEELNRSYTNNIPEINVTLPDTNWNLEFTNNDSKFKVSLFSISGSPSILDVQAGAVTLSGQNYTGTEFGETSGAYRVKYAYAFNVTDASPFDYTVVVNYSSLGVDNPVLAKCPYDFNTGKIDFSGCSWPSTTYDNVKKTATATVSGFSAFVLSQYVSPSPTGGGGAGGGGGGGAIKPRIIYITPNKEGASAQVYKGDTIYVMYDGKEYRYRVTEVGKWKVEISNLDTYLVYLFNLGQPEQIGLGSLFDRDVEVTMQVSNNFALLIFRTIERKVFQFPLLPPKERTAAVQPETRSPVEYYPAPQYGETAQYPTAMEEVEQLEMPSSPITLWTILGIALFITILVGSLALYRAKVHSMDKPPTVTRTGLEPDTSIEASKPAQLLMQSVSKVEQRLQAPEKEEPKVESKPRVELSREKKLALEKYVYHALSKGHTPEEIKKALLDNGWPEEPVERCLYSQRR